MRFFEFRIKPVDSVYKTPQDKPRQPQTHLSKTKKSEPAAKISFAHELEKYKRLPETKGLPFPGTYEQEYGMHKKKGQRRVGELTNEEQIEEKWSEKYKRSINCSNPKGFSQKAHCQGRKKK
jgi:hypothetical protein